jgi:hypothetical protein
MANGERQIPGHVQAAYGVAVDNILFLKKQQWLATNYVPTSISGRFPNLGALLQPD